MAPKNLLLEMEEPGIRIVKISRREALNALNTETLEELKGVLMKDSVDPKIRVVILTGDGDKSFIAGADIAEMKDKSASQVREPRNSLCPAWARSH
jgi:enoyl-CoA hydratase